MSHKYLVNDLTGQVFAFEEDGSQDDFIPAGLRAMSPQEISRHLNPEPAYWTNGVDLILSSGVVPGWRFATSVEVDALRPAMQLREVTQQAAALRQTADYAIAPLQDAVDLEEATGEEVEMLKAWKRYRVALSRLPEHAGWPTEIDWPAPPA
ncbi:tail fiber assembly protein [Pseudomonas sp. NY11955]|uniref:tail fiber assembly protein n=1 Tax=Pseudomonas sp. NY11955 TaxID=3400363 RepID=UPI003A8AB025